MAIEERKSAVMATEHEPEKDSQEHKTDEERLAQLGHVQELKRSFSIWSLGSLCICLMATWEALSSVVALALASGGAPCLFYNYTIAFIGTIAVAVSLAEIASIYPTAGGQYHWVAALAPAKYSRAASWFTGWISIGGQICLTASAAFAGGLQYRGLIALNDEDYIAQSWHGLLFYWAVLAYAIVINVFGSKILAHTNNIAGILHITGFIAITIVLGVMAPKHDSRYVFVETVNATGWSSGGLAWMIGLLSAVYPFLGYDAAAHLSEELPFPSRNVPIAMVGSVIFNGVGGLVYCIVLLFSLGDLDSLLASSTGFPFMQLYFNVTNSVAGATIMALIPTAIATFATAAGLTSTSRTFWAFARDKAIPGSSYFSHVDPSSQLPLRMIVLVGVLQLLLGLIYLASNTAFNAILSMAVLGMYLSYVLPIVYMLLYGRNGSIRQGTFRLGKFTGLVINAFAIVWLVIAMIFSTLPNFYPVDKANMNYSTVVLAGWTVVGALIYFGKSRRTYEIPVVG